jgi:hypothetical protein
MYLTIFQIMEFMKTNNYGRFPILDSDLQNGTLLSPNQSTTLYPDKVNFINLGIALNFIPQGSLLQISNYEHCYKPYKILQEYLFTSPESIVIPIISQSQIVLAPDTLLCHIGLVPITAILPGNFK